MPLLGFAEVAKASPWLVVVVGEMMMAASGIRREDLRRGIPETCQGAIAGGNPCRPLPWRQLSADSATSDRLLIYQ
ncbi:hypothetical protein ACTXJR_16530 [Glutamicibacter ardleyensis]|uniref:hypothetical protein n=1 Tax=Glutamicibacter ardleyensis TaxID=225894 RepID=UPI003FD22B9E